jgi:hypothetical protein
MIDADFDVDVILVWQGDMATDYHIKKITLVLSVVTVYYGNLLYCDSILRSLHLRVLSYFNLERNHLSVP